MTISRREECASDVDLMAADWFQRRQFWTLTEGEHCDFEAWLDESDTHRIAYLRQSAVWNSAARLVALKSPMRANSASAKPKRLIVIRIAAAIAIAASIGVAAVNYFNEGGEVTYATSVGGHKIVTFGDGTRIELNTDTVLRVARADQRSVNLVHGEAYFEVRHDANHPFAVNARNYRVTDLGTKFLIRAGVSRLQVSLLEGSAVVAPLVSAKSSHPVLLAPGDVVTADAKSLSVQRRTTKALAIELGWRRGVLTFKDTTLADASAEFNRYNTQKIVLPDPGVARLKINGTFQARNIELFAASAQELFGLHVNKVGSETRLGR